MNPEAERRPQAIDDALHAGADRAGALEDGVSDGRLAWQGWALIEVAEKELVAVLKPDGERAGVV